MSWIGNTLLPAIAVAMQRHHAPPRMPASPSQLAGWLRASGAGGEAEYVAKLAPGGGFTALLHAAHQMVEGQMAYHDEHGNIHLGQPWPHRASGGEKEPGPLPPDYPASEELWQARFRDDDYVEDTDGTLP